MLDAVVRGNNAATASDAVNCYAEVIGLHPDEVDFPSWLLHAEAAMTRDALPEHTKPMSAVEHRVKNIGEALLETSSRLDKPRALAVLELLEKHPSRLFRLSRVAVAYNKACRLADSEATISAALRSFVGSVQLAFAQLEKKYAAGKPSPTTCECLADTLELIRDPIDLQPLIATCPQAVEEVERILQACVGRGFKELDFSAIKQRLAAVALSQGS